MKYITNITNLPRKIEKNSHTSLLLTYSFNKSQCFGLTDCNIKTTLVSETVCGKINSYHKLFKCLKAPKAGDILDAKVHVGFESTISVQKRKL